MDYYDGNTVTGLWNYAQHFAMSDNSYSTTFGPSTPGAINVTAANTFGAICGPTQRRVDAPACTGTLRAARRARPPAQPQPQGPGTATATPTPTMTSAPATQDGKTAAQTIQMGGKNIGDLLDQAGITWGWFQGGFASPDYVPGRPSTDDLTQGVHRHATTTSAAPRRPTTAPTTSRSSTTPRPPTRSTCRRPRSR